jgi:hypothetical protein
LIELDVNESREFAVTVNVSNAGLYSISISASSAQGASNRSSVALKVLECEPGSKVCDGAELWSCSSDGMASNKTVCEHVCINAKCAESIIMNVSSNASGGSGADVTGGYMLWLAAGVVIVVAALAAVLYLAR